MVCDSVRGGVWFVLMRWFVLTWWFVLKCWIVLTVEIAGWSSCFVFWRLRGAGDGGRDRGRAAIGRAYSTHRLVLTQFCGSCSQFGWPCMGVVGSCSELSELQGIDRGRKDIVC